MFSGKERYIAVRIVTDLGLLAASAETIHRAGALHTGP